MPWLLDSVNLSTYPLRLLLTCLGSLDVVLLDKKNGCLKGGVCLRGLGIGENYDFFLAEPIFKIGSDFDVFLPNTCKTNLIHILLDRSFGYAPNGECSFHNKGKRTFWENNYPENLKEKTIHWNVTLLLQFTGYS